MNLVSVIVPVYNSEKYISKCIDSVLNQTYKNFELILINDGSCDNSLKILKEYEKKDSRIKVLTQDNMGVSKTRNKAIKLSKGKYIMFIDNDDFIDEDYIETFVNNIESDNYDVVIGGYKRVNIDNKILFKQELKDAKFSKYIVMAPWAKIYKRDFLVKNNIEFLSYPIGEDVYFNLTMQAKKPSIKIINYIGYNWFFNTKSVSNTSQRGLNSNIDITYLIDEIIKKYDNVDDILSYYFTRYYIWYLLFSGRKSTNYEFINYYKKVKQYFKDKNIKNKISPFSNKIKGETLKNRLIVFMFLMIEKFHLIRVFSKVYCKGR